MSEPTCPRCDKPIHDTAYVCGPCARKVSERCGTAMGLLRHVVETIARQDRLGETQRVTSNTHPLPVNLGAADRYGAAKTELGTWARHVASERGYEVPDGIAAALQLLAGSCDWLRYRPEAQEALQAIDDACRQIERIPDRRLVGKLVGWCAPCEQRLYALDGKETTTCIGCEKAYKVAEARAELLEMGRDEPVTAAEAADIIVGYGPEHRPARDRLRKLIYMWAERELVFVHSWTDERTPRYALGPVIDRWTTSLAARVA